MKKFIIFGLVILASLWAACERKIPSDFNIDSLPEPPRTPANLRILMGDNFLTLSWEMANASTIQKYFIYRSASSADTLRLYDSTTLLTYNDAGVQNGVRYFYAVSALSDANIEGGKSAAISAVPGVFAISIASGAQYTKSLSVTIIPTAPDQTSFVMLSNSMDFSLSQWQSFGSSLKWELPVGDGNKTVYAKFKDVGGIETAEAYSDVIILDTRAQVDSFYIIPDTTEFSAGEHIRFLLETGESGGTAEVQAGSAINLTLYDDGSNGDLTANDGIYAFEYVIPPQVEVNAATVTANFTDRAGNQAPEVSLPHLVTISSPPEAPVLLAVGAKEDKIDVSWNAKSITDFAFYRLYRSKNPTVDLSSDLAASFSNQNTVTYTDTALTPATTYYYRLYIYDKSGQNAGSNIVSKATIANLAPSPVSLAIETVDSTNFHLTWTRNNDGDFGSYRIYRARTSGVTNDPGDLLVILNSQSSTEFSDQGIITGVTYYYKVFVYDRFGASAGSNEVSGPKQ